MDENEKQLNNKNIKVLRTYTSDMANAIRDNEMSVITIALAEKAKREEEELYRKAEGTSTSKIFLSIGGIILIAAAILGSYYLVQKKKEKDAVTPIINNIETFISYDSSSVIDVTSATNILELKNIINQKEQASTGTITALFLTKKINNISEIITASNFLSLVGTTAPSALIRSLSDTYLFGKYSNENSVDENAKFGMFLILQTTNYNQTYVSALEWEKTLLSDLFVLFNMPEQNSSLLDKEWKDIIINNKDARVLYGENGQGVLYYVFLNKNNFVIANNVDALKEVMSRLLIKNI